MSLYLYKQGKNKMADQKKYKELKKIITHLEIETEKAKKLLASLYPEKEDENKIDSANSQDNDKLIKDIDLNQTKIDGEIIIEGVFNGQFMIGADGKQYSIPANYASKSKLVEGDILKLKINPNGNFVFKQIGPIERERKFGVVVEEDDEQYIIAEGKKYKVIKASLTYFKADEGDEVVIVVPKGCESQWAAVENIIKKETVMKIEQSK